MDILLRPFFYFEMQPSTYMELRTQYFFLWAMGRKYILIFQSFGPHWIMSSYKFNQPWPRSYPYVVCGYVKLYLLLFKYLSLTSHIILITNFVRVNIVESVASV